MANRRLKIQESLEKNPELVKKIVKAAKTPGVVQTPEEFKQWLRQGQKN